jgi:hypothetical protein
MIARQLGTNVTDAIEAGRIATPVTDLLRKKFPKFLSVLRTELRAGAGFCCSRPNGFKFFQSLYRGRGTYCVLRAQ